MKIVKKMMYMDDGCDGSRNDDDYNNDINLLLLVYQL